MNWVLGSQVQHPPELLKSRQVLKLDLSKICHLKGADILDLTLGVGALKCDLLLITLEIGLNSG